MKLARLYIDGFMCYDKGYIDFNEFSAALVVGKQENNDHFANGVGKTTIFKAIEYVLFNYSDIPLERIIRDDAANCRIVLDFTIGEQEYRLSRTRSKKSTDLTLLERVSPTNEGYHTIQLDGSKTPCVDKKVVKGFWKDISGSRATDTEKDLAKLIKINQKAFRSTVLFPQDDLAGLPTATPEKRKGILKEALGLAIYTKLEKVAKEKSAALVKDIDKHRTLIDSLGDPAQDLKALTAQATELAKIVDEKTTNFTALNVESSGYADQVAALTNKHAALESRFAALLSSQKSLTADKSKLEISVKEYQTKKSNVIKVARDMVDEVNTFKANQTKLAALDYSQIDIRTEEMEKKKELVTQLNVSIKNSMEKLEELKVPLPSGSRCQTCRKPMSDKDRKDHKEHIAQDMAKHQAIIQSSKKDIARLNAEVTAHSQSINSLNLSKQQLESLNLKITAKNKEIQDKSAQHDEYAAQLKKFRGELESKEKELVEVAVELQNSSIEEAEQVKKQIEAEKVKLAAVTVKISALNKEIAHQSQLQAVIQHSIDQKIADNDKKSVLKKDLDELNGKFATYPSVIQAFSSTGIPNLIIQNVLDDLQIESNNLLSQLKPGIQLTFSIEKTIEKTGDQADTLDINYTVHGKERYYEQLSGAQRLAVLFSLKLGLSFLLQKMIGTDIKFLLLDEIDQSLDKASVDAFADIVKFFQKEYTILIITHNDRLKDKFSHAILVEQDANMVSTAKVVSSW